MICSRCVSRLSRCAPVVSIARHLSTTTALRTAPPSATASAAPARASPPTAEPARPASISPAGTVLRGLNYLKGRSDPIALPDEDYPAWLWTLLDVKKVDATEAEDADLFAKSKKLRRKAAKRQRKMEALRAASGELYNVKVPLTQQSIDLPSNKEDTIEGAIEAVQSRKELRAALRSERRKGIKERNYLNSV
ncbi:hypothetical protein K3495_g9855 [Podosphaera aphanis]|nr:hypothetical protein K3495_g9855 [Podosphaera aphanis]